MQENKIDPIVAYLTWDNLYSWAVTQPIAGYANSSHYCPIARFLNEATESKWTVDEGKAALIAKYREGNYDEVEKETYSLPQWATIVADAVDAVERDRITREQFLRIMNEVRAETSELFLEEDVTLP